ncbi:hypothetical protein [Microbacterium amylolyticum]|uniref:hypothetical protein n=1 Tax=Microbacterium amylolyticum TaxID=936337 RepID=UPI0013EC2344|nr:hypothetical protein [Microbacterium amylolyticum]
MGIADLDAVEISEVVIPEEVAFGGALEFSFTLVALRETDVIADYAVRPLAETYALREGMTTRTVRSGSYQLDIHVNGRVSAS